MEFRYLVLRTGYTHRLPEDADEMFGGEGEGDLLCAADGSAKRLWSKFRFFGLHDRKDKEHQAIIKLYEDMGDELDGSVVIRLGGFKMDFARALNGFHRVFGTGNDHEYCGGFYGVPVQSREIEVEGLGAVLVLDFDCESG